ncbi:MAG: hypothetical protein AB9869_34665 [Verrucomicrobiia bacterium]
MNHESAVGSARTGNAAGRLLFRRRLGALGLGSLLLLAVCGAAWSAAISRQTSDSLPNQAPHLDSFAPPSVALAVLRHELQRLALNYTQTERPPAQDRQMDSPKPDRADVPNHLEGDAVVFEISRLHREIEAFKQEVEVRLLWVYSEALPSGY